MKTIRSIRLTALVAAVSALVITSTATAQNPWPSNEEIQSLAYKRDLDIGPNAIGFRSMEAGLSLIDKDPGVDRYYGAGAGMSNFAGRTTVEAGAIRFCISGQPQYCNLKPFGVVSDTNTFQRTILTDVSISGSSFFTYRAERVNNPQPTNTYQALWCFGTDCRKVLDGQLNAAGLPFAYTRAMSVGPKWIVTTVKAAKFYADGYTRFVGCYSATDNKNHLSALPLPYVIACKPTIGDWQHVFANNVNVPIIKK